MNQKKKKKAEADQSHHKEVKQGGREQLCVQNILQHIEPTWRSEVKLHLTEDYISRCNLINEY